MRELVSDLHLKYGNALQAYAGDTTELPDFASPLGSLLQQPETGSSAAAPTKMSRNQWLFMIGGLLAMLVFLAACCFYIRFTYALLPVAFPPPTASSTKTLTQPPMNTSTNPPTSTPTGTPTATATLVPPSPTPTMTATAVPFTAVALEDVWLRAGPSEDTRWLGVVQQGTSVHVLSASSGRPERSHFSQSWAVSPNRSFINAMGAKNAKAFSILRPLLPTPCEALPKRSKGAGANRGGRTIENVKILP